MTRPSIDVKNTEGRQDDHLGVPGLILYQGFLDADRQREVLAAVDSLPWRDDLKRRVQHYGYRYDYKARRVDQSMRLGDLPPFAADIADRLLEHKLVPERPDQVIVNEYLPGQGISAHVDCEPCFKDGIVTISLGAAYEMDFVHVETREVRSTLLGLGSAVVMTGPSRYEWMHQIKGRKSDQNVPRKRRVSLTFRKVIVADEPTEHRESHQE